MEIIGIPGEWSGVRDLLEDLVLTGSTGSGNRRQAEIVNKIVVIIFIAVGG